MNTVTRFDLDPGSESDPVFAEGHIRILSLSTRSATLPFKIFHKTPLHTMVTERRLWKFTLYYPRSQRSVASGSLGRNCDVAYHNLYIFLCNILTELKSIGCSILYTITRPGLRWLSFIINKLHVMYVDTRRHCFMRKQEIETWRTDILQHKQTKKGVHRNICT